MSSQHSQSQYSQRKSHFDQPDNSDEMTGLEDERKAMDIVLNFSEVYCTVSCKIFTKKLINYGLDVGGWRMFMEVD